MPAYSSCSSSLTLLIALIIASSSSSNKNNSNNNQKKQARKTKMLPATWLWNYFAVRCLTNGSNAIVRAFSQSPGSRRRLPQPETPSQTESHTVGVRVRVGVWVWARASQWPPLGIGFVVDFSLATLSQEGILIEAKGKRQSWREKSRV